MVQSTGYAIVFSRRSKKKKRKMTFKEGKMEISPWDGL